MNPLVDGAKRFLNGVYPGLQSLFQQLAGGQKPETLFITCADSRIDPHLITQSQPGSLFVVRNAGNIVPPYGMMRGGEAGSIEFAVKALGVKRIVVCGHSRCGAMQGLLAPESLAALPAVKEWLEYAKDTRDLLEQRHPEAKGDALLDAAIRENVLLQIEHLKTHPAVREALDAGSLELNGWVYDIGSGEIVAHAGDADDFAAINLA